MLPEQHKSGSKIQKHGQSFQKPLRLNNTATEGQVTTLLTHGRKAAKQEPNRAVCSAHKAQPPHDPGEVPAKAGRGRSRGSITEGTRWDTRFPHGVSFAAGAPPKSWVPGVGWGRSVAPLFPQHLVPHLCHPLHPCAALLWGQGQAGDCCAGVPILRVPPASSPQGDTCVRGTLPPLALCSYPAS